MILYFLILLILVIIYSILKNRLYYSAGYIGLICIYETMPFIIYASDDNDFTKKMSLFVRGLNDALINTEILFILAYILFIYLILIFLKKLHRTKHVLNPTIKTIKEDDWSLTSFLLLFILGTISLLNGDAAARINEYTQVESLKVSSYHFYMITILPLSSYFLIKLFFDKKYKAAIFNFIYFIPAIVVLFGAGRRQVFIPVVLLIFYFLFRKPNLSFNSKIIYTLIIIASTLGIFAIQYSVRYIAFGAISGDSVSIMDFTDNIFAPQIGEFLAVGATTVAAYGDYVANYRLSPLGLISFIEHATKGIPLIGNILILDYSRQTIDSIVAVSPFGALTIAAEGLIFFGLPGLFFNGFIIGFILIKFENVLHPSVCVRGLKHFKEIAMLCLLSILLFKYRSGLIDSFNSAIRFILMSVIVYYGSYLTGFGRRIFR